MEKCFIKFAKVLRRENGRSEFSEENSRNPVSRQISQRSKEVTVVIFSKWKLRRERVVDSCQ
jgi:hypothetical protein